jgi:hypothetical protein
VPGVPFHSFHKIGDQIVSALELHVDTAPAFQHEVSILYQFVENRDSPEGYEGENAQNDPANHNSLLPGG